MSGEVELNVYIGDLQFRIIIKKNLSKNAWEELRVPVSWREGYINLTINCIHQEVIDNFIESMRVCAFHVRPPVDIVSLLNFFLLTFNYCHWNCRIATVSYLRDRLKERRKEHLFNTTNTSYCTAVYIQDYYNLNPHIKKLLSYP